MTLHYQLKHRYMPSTAVYCCHFLPPFIITVAHVNIYIYIYIYLYNGNINKLIVQKVFILNRKLVSFK